MARIGLFYGTQIGNTQIIAELIQSGFGGNAVVNLHDICDASPDDFEPYPFLIVGCPTWGIGELQTDWKLFFDQLDQIDFRGKKVAYFGCGDQINYPDNFQDAMGILEQRITQLGGKTVGYTSTAGYHHCVSKAVRGDQFVGLAIDEDNQSELTDKRVKAWVNRLKLEFTVP